MSRPAISGTSPQRLRIALAAASGALLLAACAPEQQATQTRPVTRADDEIGALMRVAAMTRQSGDFDTAVALYRRAHELEPRDPQPLIELAQMLDERGTPGDAALLWQDALRLAPDNVVVLGGYGVTMARLGQPEIARPNLEKATAVAPTAMTWNALGVVRDQLGDATGAQSAYRAGLALEPSDLRLANNLGLSLALSGQFDEALKLLENAVARPDATSRHRQNLALTYALAGRDEEAARLTSGDVDAVAAQRNFARYAGIAALPDHASRVAAVSALREPAPDRRQAATPKESAAPVKTASRKPDTTAVEDDRRITPLVTATRLSPAKPAPAPVPSPAIAVETPPPPEATRATANEFGTRTVQDVVATDSAPKDEAASVAVAPKPPAEAAVAAAEMQPLPMPAPAQRTGAPDTDASAKPGSVETSADSAIAAAPQIYRSKTFIPPEAPGGNAVAAAPVVDDVPPLRYPADAEPAMPIDSADAGEGRDAIFDDGTDEAPLSVAEAPAVEEATIPDAPVGDAGKATKAAVGPAEAAPDVATEPAANDSGVPAFADLPLALAGVEVPPVEDILLFAASAYHAGEYEAAAKVWQPLADAGNVRAQFHLGALHYEGRGVDRDLGKAYMLLRQAEMAGFGDARIILALVESKLPAAERRKAEAQVAALRP